MNTKVFPTMMIVLSVGAAVMWALDGNWRMTLYWGAAACLTFSVTY